MTATRDRFPNFPAPQGSVESDGAMWQWQHWDGLPYLTCRLLSQWPHGFFTQQFAPKMPTELVNVLESTAPVYRVKQVHGNVVLRTSELKPQFPPPPGPSRIDPHLTPGLETSDFQYQEADGLVTDREGEAVWVCTADCVPVLIADTETGRVAAVHAGWRGTAARIVPEAISQLTAQGSQLKHLRIALGPAIAGEVYQVSQDVAAQLGATIAPATVANDAANVLDFLHQLPKAPVLTDPEPGKVRLDVRRCNALQLEQLGIHSSQVAIAPYCTYSEPAHFFSYRRDNLKNVQWSGIVSQA